MLARWRRLRRDIRSGLSDPYTFDLGRNAHLWVGVVWALTMPACALWVDLAARGVPASADEVGHAIAQRPIHLWFLAQPLLLSALFGAFGTLRARRLRQLARLQVERDRSRRDAEFMGLRQLEVDAAKDRLLSAVSHELKTPLASLKGYAELLRARRLGPLTESQERAIDVVLRAANRECVLIEDLLRFARLESKRYPIDATIFDLRAAVQDARDAIQADADRRAVTVEVIVPARPLPVSADRAAIAHAIENLVSNAVKFAPHGGHARVIVAHEGTTAVVTVEDDGPGVPPELRDRVFEAFFQADMGDSRVHGGAGIGLPVAKGIVEAHGGTLTAGVSSALGGASFSFALSLARGAPLVGAAPLGWESDTVPPSGARDEGGERPPVR